MTTERPIDLDTLTLGAVLDGVLRGRPITVLGLRPERDRPRPVPRRRGRRRDGLRRPAGRRAGRCGRRRSRDARSGCSSGPDVDPASAWAGAALVATSPSINPDYPTTEPRLRAALRGLVDAGAAADSGARLGGGPVPAPLPGADDRRHRHEGQDDDVVADRRGPRRGPDSPGRARAATSASRSSSGCRSSRPSTASSSSSRSSSCRRCRAGRRSRSTRTSRPTTSTGTARSRATGAAKRRLAELVDPAGALVLNADDPVVAAYAELRDARRSRSTARGAAGAPAASGVVDGWIVDDGAGRIMPIDELAIPGRHNVSNALAAVAVGRLVRHPARRDPPRGRRASPASSTASSRSRRSTASASSTTRRAPSRTRSSPRSRRSSRRSC